MMRWTTEVADHLAQKESSLPPPGQLCNRDWRVQKRATHSARPTTRTGWEFLQLLDDGEDTAITTIRNANSPP